MTPLLTKLLAGQLVPVDAAVNPPTYILKCFFPVILLATCVLVKFMVGGRMLLWSCERVAVPQSLKGKGTVKEL